MAAGVRLAVMTPDQRLLLDEVEMVVVPGLEGDMGIMAAHMPLISVLRPGRVQIWNGGAPVREIMIGGGIVEVRPHGVRLLVTDVGETPSPAH